MSTLTDEDILYHANPGKDLRLINRRMIPRLAKEILDLRRELAQYKELFASAKRVADLHK